jgi:hypothetical protein
LYAADRGGQPDIDADELIYRQGVESSTVEMLSSYDFTIIEHDGRVCCDQKSRVFSGLFCAQTTPAFVGLQKWHGACIKDD